MEHVSDEQNLALNMTVSNEICAFYEDKNILITGGTGFMGKVLIQKLFRCCKNVHLFLLLRRKKSLSTNDRAKIIFDDVIFGEMKTAVPDFMNNITIIEGDISCKSLNILPDVADMLKEKIQIVFHCAADLNMKRNIKAAVHSNVRGCHELLQLCKSMKHLDAVMVVSSTYAANTSHPLEEKYYVTNISPKMMIEMCDELDDSALEDLQPVLMESYVNIYSYTKTLAERVAGNISNEIPIGVFRPSSVTSVYEDPLPGWTDNVYGALMFIVLVLSGTMRVVNVNSQAKVNFVPVDLCVNALISSAWDVNQRWPKKKELVYNFTCSGRWTWEHFKDMMLKNYKYAFRGTMWAPFVITSKSRILFTCLNFILHRIPYYVCHTISLVNKKWTFHKIYRKVDQFNTVAAKYGWNEWEVSCENWKLIWKRMSPEAKAMFPFDVDKIEQDRNFEIMSQGLKEFFLKEDLTNKRDDERRLQRLFAIQRNFIYSAGVLFAMVMLYLCYAVPKLL